MMKLTKLAGLLLLMASTQIQANNSIRFATFNVSMEALNYVNKGEKVTGKELLTALNNNNQQIKNIAEIIQRIKPDVLLINEIDNYSNEGRKALVNFLTHYLAEDQNGQAGLQYAYFYQAPVNTGVLLPADANGDGKISNPADTHGFGYFPGQYAMAVLSNYPIDSENVRTFQHFKWQDMPGALKPVDPATKQDYYSKEVWDAMRLSSKSHWDLPILFYDQVIHFLVSHPTPPVFDGPEDRNGKRNHDEIRFWLDYITPGKNDYIYDDKQKVGGLKSNDLFVIAGDLNASAVEGDAINSGIAALLNHPNVQDPKPSSKGAKLHTPDNVHGQHHTAYWRMRADYVLPSKQGLKIEGSGVYWPTKDDEQYRLIDSRKASSDHRLVWVDLKLAEHQ